MQLKYTVKVTNPIKNYLKVQDSFKTLGAFSIDKTKTGLMITGELEDSHRAVKAYSYSFLGEDYLLTETDQLSFQTDFYKSVDVISLFQLIDTPITGSSFQRVQSSFKLAKKGKNNSFTIDHYVEKSTDVFLIKINSEGEIKKANGSVRPYSNVITFTVEPDLTDVIGYFLISKPLKVSTNDYLYVSNEDLLKIPVGFCTIANKVVAKNVTSMYAEDGHHVLVSSLPNTLTTSSPILVDGVKVSNYKLAEGEQILVEPTRDLEPVTLTNLEGNVTLIYQVTSTNEVIPSLAIVDINMDIEESDDASLRDFLAADSEFLKRYVMQEYKIKLTTTTNEYNLLNSDVLQRLRDTNEFEGKIIKL